MTSPATHNLRMVVQVLQVLPFGVLVSLSDSRTTIIRKRELAWHDDERWREQLKPGDRLETVLVDASDHSMYPELSARLAQRDPWTTFHQRYSAGQECHGIITEVAGEQARVEIEPGVIGTLPRTELPAWAQHYSCSELFWPGDHVAVTLDWVDAERRYTRVSVADSWSQQWQSDAASLPSLDQQGTTARVLLRSIAVVAPQNALPPWIAQGVLHPVAATSVEHALALLQHEPPAVLLVHLHSLDTSALAALHQARDTWPGTRCVLVLERAALATPVDALDQIATRGVRVLLAPLQYQDWQEALIDSDDVPVQPLADADTHLLDYVTSVQRLAMLGQLTRAFVHEINHHVSPVTFALYDLKSQYARIERRMREGSSEMATDIARANETLANLDQGVQQLLHTVRLFRQVASLQHKPGVSSDEIMRDAVDLVRDLTDRQHIIVTLHSDKLEPVAPALAVPLRQIMVSALLCTIQRFAGLGAEREGHIRIRPEHLGDERGDRLHITIEDDGPGIHRWLWEQIFESSYITSHDQDGCGLPVTRSQVEALGGRIFVAESWMLGRTRVVIDLPLDTIA